MESVSSDVQARGGLSRLDPARIAIGLLAGALVYIAYYPSDSVAVERGDALWLTALAIVIAAIAWATVGWVAVGSAAVGWRSSSEQTQLERDRSPSGAVPERFPMNRWAARTLDLAPWLLAGWIMLAAFATSPPGNLRMATNEAWVWLSAAAIFTATRRLSNGLSTRKALIVLMVVCGSGLAVHGLHQHWISLPNNRAEYQRDPERVLELAGVDAPVGSAERMVFENRLFDGGPTGTFALANSLAATLVFVLVIAAGMLRNHWSQMSKTELAAWIITLLLCGGCLLAARSRAAMLATFAGWTLAVILPARSQTQTVRAAVWGIGGLIAAGILGLILLALRGNREWFEAAPASLAFRFQYWRSTWRMVLDHPWFGAGPGNFQSIYERYREPSANEQIAEPHNLLFETMASGGMVAAALLICIVAASIVLLLRRPSPTGLPHVDQDDPSERAGAAWVGMGAFLSLAMIWLIGLASRHLPDAQAAVFILPTIAILGRFQWFSVRHTSSAQLDQILCVAVSSVLIHLLVSGGWTVPGVSVLIWVGAGILTRPGIVPAELPGAGLAGPGKPRPRWARPAWAGAAAWQLGWLAIGTGILLLFIWNRMSLRPVEAQERLMNLAARAQAAGQSAKTRTTLQRAVEADPWSPDASLWLADSYRWELISRADSAAIRKRWETALQAAKQSAGQDPAVYRMIGAQQIHLFQRFGIEADLRAAEESFRDALRWGPANEWMIAQVAAIARATGAAEEADQLTHQAWEYSRLGGNIERAMSRQQIYVPEKVGVAANLGPIRRPADQLLPEPNLVR